jgi:hypothetical protein
MTRFFIASSFVTVAVLFGGWAHAQSIEIPPGAVCKVTKTTIKVDAKGRVVITDTKVCEVPETKKVVREQG